MAPPFANPLQAVAAAVRGTADQLAGATVIYRRAGSADLRVRAIRARYVTDETTPAPYLAIAHRLVDWLIDPSQTPTPPTPQPGDIVVADPDGAPVSYRLFAPGPSAPVWTWGGPQETWRRITTERL